MDPLIDRVPPHNLEAEKSILGAIFLEPESLITAAEIIQEDDFHRVAHQKIFETMLRLNDKGEPVDVVTLSEELGASNELENVGGMVY